MAWLNCWKRDYINHENQNEYGDRCGNRDRRTETKTVGKLRVIGKKGARYDETIRHLMAAVNYERFVRERYKIGNSVSTSKSTVKLIFGLSEKCT